MKIAIDISPLIYGTGVSVYTMNLVRNLLEIDKDNTYTLAGYSLRRISELHTFISGLKGHYKNRIVRLPPTIFEFLWNKLHIVNFESIFGECDVYHSSDWAQAPAKAYKVTTIHDLVPILYPQYSLPRLVSVNKRRLELVKKEVDKIIVPSKQTFDDLLGLGFAKDKIVIIPEAVEDSVRPATSTMKEAVKDKFSVTKNFFLAVGITPRKNIGRIIEAFSNLNVSNEFELVIIGEPKIDIKNTRNVIFTGHITQEELISFYSSAIALVYPSLYEGFGLPIIESLKCHTPVVTSNFGAMKEVGGDSCVLVDPYSIKSIQEGMELTLTSKEIKNLEQTLSKYSWKTTAEKTLQVYLEAKK